MRASHDLSRVSVSFDEPNLVPCAGLLPAAVLEVPPGIDREIARLKLAALDVTLDILTESQLAYLTSWSS